MMQRGFSAVRRAVVRHYSTLPKDLEEAASRARYPARRATPRADAAGAAAEAPLAAKASPSALSPGAAADAARAAEKAAEQAKIMQEGAKIATTWMFPWERRQMQGDGKLRTWEKLYWGVFVMGLGLLAFNHLGPERIVESEEQKRKAAEKEERKKERARAVLAGASFVGLGDDPFEGLNPDEIAKYVAEAAGAEGASEADPFEGMTPEEINDYVERQGLSSSTA